MKIRSSRFHTWRFALDARFLTCRTALVGGVALSLFALTACSSSSSSTVVPTSTATSATIQKDAALAAEVPASIVSAGNVRVGSDTTYPPSEFLDTDNTTIIGFDVDLGKAIGQVLGVPFQFQTAPFDSIITGLGSKYDVGISSFTINPAREAKANMVSYFSAGTQWAAAAGNPSGITPDTACGKKVAVQTATVQETDLNARSKACTAAGKPAITIDSFGAQTAATAAVVAGKDDAMLSDLPVVIYAISQSGGKLQAIGAQYEVAPYGVVVPKTETKFATAIQGAVQKLIDGGQYAAILKMWNVAQGAIKTSELNPATSG